MLKRLSRTVRRILDKVLLILVATLCAWVGAAILTSGWCYFLVDGEVKRAWCIQAPGFYEYVDLTAVPPVKRSSFDLRRRYRVSPWFPTEDAVPLIHVSPNGYEPESSEYAAEVWCIKQGLTVPLEEKQPQMYRGMVNDYERSGNE